MHLYSNRIAVAVFAGLLGLAVVALQAQAVDGVIEINSAAALAGGVTAGDTPGYPVTISANGSYRLTGNLESSGNNVDIIEITANDVTLDLNGFTIRCLWFINPCAGNGSGNGVIASGVDGTVVRNGVVRDMASHRVFLESDSRVENLRAIGNGLAGISLGHRSAVIDSNASYNLSWGILLGSGGIAEGCHASRNGSWGIGAGSGSTVTRSTASYNTGDGIAASGSAIINNASRRNSRHGIDAGNFSTVIGNTVSFNTRCGLSLSNSSGYGQNVLDFNNGASANLQVHQGTQLGTNYCGGHACTSGPVNNCP